MQDFILHVSVFQQSSFEAFEGQHDAVNKSIQKPKVSKGNFTLSLLWYKFRIAAKMTFFPLKTKL